MGKPLGPSPAELRMRNKPECGRVGLAMATYHDTKLKTAQAKAAVVRAKAKAPPPGPLLLTIVLTLVCFLASDYLLYSDSCIEEDAEAGFFRKHC